MAKGANVALTREVPNLTIATLGVSWNAGGETSLAENLVTATLLCGKDGHVLSSQHFVFFNLARLTGCLGRPAREGPR